MAHGLGMVMVYIIQKKKKIKNRNKKSNPHVICQQIG